jgi:hypothetical protein
MARVGERNVLLEGPLPDIPEFLKLRVGKFHTRHDSWRGCGVKGGEGCNVRHKSRLAMMKFL